MQGTTLEQPPSQPNGSAFNASMSVGAVSAGTPLADGASIDVRILLGVQQQGTFRFAVVPEALPEAGISGGSLMVYGCTNGCPLVISSVRANPSPTTSATANYTVTFSEAVTGVDAADFTLTTTGLTGASVGTVTGSGTTYNVTVNTGTGLGTLRLNVIDNDTIVAGAVPLGGTGIAGSAGSGDFTTGEVYNVNRNGPTVTINQAGGQADPTGSSPINFTVVFSAAVADFATGDVTLGGTAGATTALVTGSGTTYNVAVSGMTADGTVTATIAEGVATDGSSNPNLASTSTDNSVTWDGTAPTVTINQAGGQLDPINTSPINFTVIFSEPVADFATGDVTLGGTAGATTATVSGSGTTYNVAVSGMTGPGTVTASLASGVANDSAGNDNAASTSTDNSVLYDATPPTVTINQAAGQADPTNAGTINFTVVFDEAVSGFDSSDITLGGSAGATTAVVSGAGPTYNVAVSGMTTDGTVTATVNASAATDVAGNASAASTSTDNSVTYDTTAPTVTINQAGGQVDPTGASPINFTVIFSEPVADFATGDVTLGGTAGATTATVSGSGTTYNVAVSGMTGNGTVTATLAAGVATDAAGNTSGASTSSDNSVTYDATAPTVTINQAAGQVDPTNSSPINFTVIFSEAVADFTSGDVTLGGTAGATTATVTGSGTTYNVAVSGMTGDGTVIASLGAGVATDSSGNASTASTSSDNTVTYDASVPTVTIDQAAGQVDPTSTSPINFTVIFSESVADFATGDVTLGGTAGATTATVTGSGTTYNVAVSGMTGNGTVTATLAAGVATDAGGNASAASTSSDNSVTYDASAPSVTINQAAGQVDPTGTSPINFTVVFSEPVADFATGDVTLGGTAGATTATVTGSGTTYNVAVSGMTSDGTVTATLAAGVATDAGGNASTASTSSDNTVTYDASVPSVTINQAAGQVDPTGTSPINFTVIFSEPVADFATGDVTLGGTAGATTATVTGSGTTYNVAVSGMTGNGTVTATLLAGVATDAGGNASAASTSTDNSVTYDATPPTVTIEQAAGQADPTAASPINFTVVFNEPVTTFATGDVTLGGTAGATTATVTGSGTTYNVAVSGMSGAGTVTASIAPGVAADDAGNGNLASTSADNTVTFDAAGPGVTIDQAVGQVDPTNASPILFTVVFSEPVADFATGDVTLGGTAGATTAAVSGSGTTYTVSVSGMTASGTVIATIAAGVATDATANANLASTSTDNTVTYTVPDTTAPTVVVSQAPGQTDPAPTSPVNFTVTFSEPVTGFDSGDIILGGTAGATTAVITGGPTVYNVAVSGMTANGTITVTIAAGGVTDGSGNTNTGSTSTDNTVIFVGAGSAEPIALPALSWPMLLLMGVVLAVVAGVTRRRQDLRR
ncbi:beta strand repeat-containing protein [Tahibacter amnicola]|uniref:Ig-like domain-containing protein n=1 Tax=Tahibacter amnicola TaxID=2976241 RepID=A0ABY6BKP0_9GAMM|nr:Ig-like domain-containing protein [Tahibacter amnicola]UXI70579.1 Ig-like domain-containing protein [Tahibacter amnicola]